MSTTANKGLEVPTRGSNVGVWDVPVNGNSEILDDILGSVTTKALTNVDVTLSTSEMQSMAYVFTGTLTGAVIITATMPGFYILDNRCLGAFTVKIRVSGAGEAICIPPGEVVDAYCDGTNWKFRSLGRTGTMQFWYTSSMPAWVTGCTVPPYLLCNNATFSAATYPALNAFLGGNTAPDMRSYTMIPLDNMGTGGPAGRIGTVNTGTGGTIVGSTLGSDGGSNTQGLTATQIAAHTHVATVNDPGHAHAMKFQEQNTTTGTASVINNIGVGGNTGNSQSADTGITVTNANNTGTGAAHNNMQISKMAGILVIKT